MRLGLVPSASLFADRNRGDIALAGRAWRKARFAVLARGPRNPPLRFGPAHRAWRPGVLGGRAFGPAVRNRIMSMRGVT